MAVHLLGREDFEKHQSPTAYRAEIEKRERQEIERNRAKQAEKTLSEAPKKAGAMVKKEIDRAIRDDDIGKEVHETKFALGSASNVVVGMALIVAATAADAAHNRAMMNAQEQSERQYKSETISRFNENNETQQQTLSSLQENVARENERLAAKQDTYYVEFKNETDEARKTMDSAQRKYDEEKKALRQEESKSDMTYRNEVNAAKDSLRSAENTRDASIQTSSNTRDSSINAAQMRYDADVKRIEREFTGSDRERELKNAEIRRDSTISRANDTHNANVQKYTSDYESKAASAQQRIDAATQRHEGEIKSINDRSVAAQTKLDNTINHQNDVIKTAQIKYNDKLKNAEMPLTNAQERLSNYQAHNKERADSAITALYGKEGKNQTVMDIGREHTRKLGTAEERRLVDRVMGDLKAEEKAASQGKTHERTTSDAERSKAVEITQKYTLVAVGKDLADKYGTKDEKALMNAVRNDIKAENKAAKQGVPFEAKTTPEQRQMAAQLAERFAVSAIGATAGAATYNVHVGTAHMGKAAMEFTKNVEKKHSQLGHDLAMKFGSEKEVALLQRVDADKKAEMQAKKEGQPYVRQTTEVDRKEADKITKKYAGDISSEKGIKATMSGYNKALNQLKDEKTTLQGSIGMAKDNAKAVDEKIAGAQQIVNQIKADQKALKTNTNAEGVKLTAAQRKEITERLKKAGDIAGHKQNLANLKQQKVGLNKEIAGLDKQLNSTQKLITGLTSHMTLLGKGGKRIADTIKANGGNRTLGEKIFNQPHISKFERFFDPIGSAKKVKDFQTKGKEKGQSKSAKKMQEKGFNMVFNSISGIGQRLNATMNRGNALQQEISRSAKTFQKAGKYYDLALSVSKTSLSVLGMTAGLMMIPGKYTMRIIGEHTRLGQKLAAFMKKDGVQNVLNGAKIIGRGQMNLLNAALKAPKALLDLPNTIAKLPQTIVKEAAKGTLRIGRKAVGKVGGATMNVTGKVLKGGARIAGKGIKYGFNKVIGQRKWYQKIQGKVSDAGGVVSKIAKAVGKTVAAPFKWVFGGLKSFFAPIFSFISFLLSGAVSVITFLLGAIGWLLLMLVIIVVILAMLTSVFNAIVDWWNSNNTQDKALVSSDPQYIMNQAVNYRDAELEIYELFSQAQTNKELIPVNKSPVYYALNGETATETFHDIFVHWFGLDEESKKLKSTNTVAYDVYTSLNSQYSFHTGLLGGEEYTVDGTSDGWFTTLEDHFSAKPKQYDNISISYYDYESYYNPETSRYDEKSRYEISNAKDALSMVDSLYTQKQETMQKIEVLSYLGVGEYQLGSNGEMAQNLFWASHEIIYEEGNESADIWYHITDDDGSLKRGLKYYTGQDESQAAYTTGSELLCPDAKCLTFTYTQRDGYYTYWHESYRDVSISSPSCYDEFDADNAWGKTYHTGMATASQAFYSQYIYSNKRDVCEFDDGRSSDNYETIGSSKFHKVATNKATSSVVKNLRWGNKSTRLNFVRYIGNTYYVIDGYNNYMGTLEITRYGAYKDLYEMITSVELYDKEYAINLTDNGIISLDCFYIYWSSNTYCFDVVASQSINVSTTEKYANDRLSGDRSYGKYYTPAFYPSRVSVNCDTEKHRTWVPTEENVNQNIYVCPGHVDLEVSMVVSLIDDQGNLFNKAMTVAGETDDQGNPKDRQGSSFFGVVSWDDEMEIFGTDDLTVYGYSPAQDWAEDNELRKLAEGKRDADITYMMPGNKDGDQAANASAKAIKIAHTYSYTQQLNMVEQNGVLENVVPTFNSIVSLEDGTLLYGMMFGNTTYYVESFTSGEQTNIKCYRQIDDGPLDGPFVYDFVVRNKQIQPIQQ